MDVLKSRINHLFMNTGYYLYDVEFVRENDTDILRVMIENDSHITLDDCVNVSNILNQAFDEEDPFDTPYHLEVTSAGAEHELHTADQIQRAVGKGVYVETFEQKISGLLEAYKDNTLTIKVNHKSTTKINDMDVNFIRLAIL